MKSTFLAFAAAACLVAAPTSHATSTVLPFVEDDYRGAVTDAKARGVPLFVEIWAPW